MGYKRVTLGMRVMVVQMATYASSERDLFYKPEKSEDPVSRMKEIIDRKKILLNELQEIISIHKLNDIGL